MQLRCGGMIVTTLLQIFHGIRPSPVNKFENRSIFGKDIDKSLTFLGHPVYNFLLTLVRQRAL